ncbi:MAG: hypothetical protein KJ052_12930 [Candidatus Hydrogenedentes bacterium]|nr:hypothetical protein [Candidatus Hydrogenedentota bacterium]
MVLLAVVTALCIGMTCTGEGDVHSAQDLVERFKKEGLPYETIENIDLAGKFSYAQVEQSLALNGDGLRVEILQIDDDRTWKATEGGAAFVGLMSTALDDSAEPAPRIYQRRPYVIVVRKEPRDGMTKEVLDKIWPE